MNHRPGIEHRLSALVRDAHWPVRLLVLLAVMAFYALTATGNLSETDDAYAFAHRVEFFPATHVSDPRLIGYHTLGRCLWLGSQALGLGIRGLEILRGIAVVGAAGCLWLVLRILVRDLGIKPLPALLSTGLLAFSYGFWRYAAEADVYISAMMMCAGVLHLLLRPGGGVWRAAGIGALSGLAVLYYQPNAIPLFLAFPLLLLRNGLGAAFVYCVAGSVVAAGGYLAGFLAFWPAPLSLAAFEQFLEQRAQEFMIPPLSLRTIVVSAIRSVLALGHDVLSTNWVFGVPYADRLVNRVFSGNRITEEVFLARQAGVVVYLPLLVLPLLAAVAWRIARAARPYKLTTLRARPMPVILVWTVLTALVIGRLNPAGIEAWIVVLLPLTFLFAVLVAAPACERGQARYLVVLLAAVAVHNLAGGMALVHSQRSDLTHLRGEWVQYNAKAPDLVIDAGDANIVESLRYWSAAHILMVDISGLQVIADALARGHEPEQRVMSRGRDFGGVDAFAAVRKTLESGGRVIVFGHFFQAARYLQPGSANLTADLEQFKARFPAVYRAADGTTTHVLAGIPITGRVPAPDIPPAAPAPAGQGGNPAAGEAR